MAVKKRNKQMIKVFSPFLRLFHWTMVVCITLLFITGLYIGNPGWGAPTGAQTTTQVASIFSMSFIRHVHFVTGFVFIAAIVLRIYGAIRYPGDRLLPRFWEKKYWEGFAYATKHYLFVPVKERFYLRNSLARTAYLLVYICILIMVVTGLALFAQVDPASGLAKTFNPVNHWIGEYQVHIVHHVVAWVIVFFVTAHIYLVFRADYMERDGEVSSMVDGYKFFNELPYDAEDLDAELARERDEQYRAENIHPECLEMKPKTFKQALHIKDRKREGGGCDKAAPKPADAASAEERA